MLAESGGRSNDPCNEGILLTSEASNSATLKVRGFKPGNLLLEGIYVLESSASRENSAKVDKETAGNVIRACTESPRKVNPNVRDEDIQFFAKQ